MFDFWLFLFLYKSYSKNYFLKDFKRKHGKYIVTVGKSFEDLKMKYEKNSLDIKSTTTCKQGSFLPAFAMVQLSIKKNANYILQQRIGRIIMEDELRRKQPEKKKLKKDIKTLSIQLKSCLNVLINSVLPHKIKIVVTVEADHTPLVKEIDMIRNFLIYIN